MSSSDAIVVWIFDRLALDVALAGDLREEREQGRSMIWHWRQVLIAICIGISRPIFQHKVLALRALATGCAVNAAWLFLWSNFLHLGLPVRPALSFESIASLAIILLTQVATGWVVARTHRPYAIPMVLVFVIWLVLWHLGSMFKVKAPLADSSWAIGKSDPHLLSRNDPGSLKAKAPAGVSAGIILTGIGKLSCENG
jgi:hypothetical protein